MFQKITVDNHHPVFELDSALLFCAASELFVQFDILFAVILVWAKPLSRSEYIQYWFPFKEKSQKTVSSIDNIVAIKTNSIQTFVDTPWGLKLRRCVHHHRGGFGDYRLYLLSITLHVFDHTVIGIWWEVLLGGSLKYIYRSHNYLAINFYREWRQVYLFRGHLKCIKTVRAFPKNNIFSLSWTIGAAFGDSARNRLFGCHFCQLRLCVD